MEKNKKVLKMALCEGRHEIKEAVNGSIFKNEVNPLEVDKMELKAFNSIWNKCFELRNLGYLEYACTKYPELEGTEREDNLCISSDVILDLYVTGLTVALVAVLNVCHEEGVKVTLYHYNRDSGTYYSQEVA